MDKSIHRSVRFWDRIAEKYAKQPIANLDAYQVKLDRTQHYFTPDSVVLEFGCGTGSTALTHAPHVKNIVAIDSSPKMIEIANRKVEKSGVTNVEFLRATLSELSYPQESFDAILGLNVLHLIKDMDAAIQRSYELLKPGGVLITSTACGDEMTGLEKIFVKYILPIGAKLGLLPFVNCIDIPTLEKKMIDAGFTILEHLAPGRKASRFLIAQK